MNLPNKITLLRILLTFVFMFFLFCKGFWPKVISLAIFTIAAISDFFDGWIAHRKNQATDFGKLMDPFADKILILAAFAAFVQMQLIAAWMFIAIFAPRFFGFKPKPFRVLETQRKKIENTIF